MCCIHSQALGYLIAIQNETIKHKRKVNVGNTPLAEKVLRLFGK